MHRPDLRILLFPTENLYKDNIKGFPSDHSGIIYKVVSFDEGRTDWGFSTDRLDRV